jgi:hypothetical protein
VVLLQHTLNNKPSDGVGRFENTSSAHSDAIVTSSM